ncbi:MAG: hypothetical protein DHS20C18_11370 [Saprospiraceae bacterium]|nr:MAG: hypothetical protein DHS20C18_11370 [Saprospiraceae bacterium]
MKIKTILIALGLLSGSIAYTQDSLVNDPTSTFEIFLNQDNAFGFYPTVSGSFKLRDNISFSFYGIFWTNPSFGNPFDGTDTWLETGIGLRYLTLGKHLTVNPFVGVTHGKVLSDNFEAILGEGIVPGILVNFLDKRFEAEGFFSYYKALKSKGRDSGDYLLYWLLPGVVLNPHVSLGIHFEGYNQVRIAEGEANVRYQKFGGYVKFTVREKYSFRFSAGTNTAENSTYAKNFYKLTVGILLTE